MNSVLTLQVLHWRQIYLMKLKYWNHVIVSLNEVMEIQICASEENYHFAFLYLTC